MDHLLTEGNPCTKFGIDQVKGSKDIERTTLGLQTDQPTDSCKTIYAAFFKGGIKSKLIKNIPVLLSILTKFPKIGDDIKITNSNVPKMNPTTVCETPFFSA